MKDREAQTASSVLMIRPVRFRSNPETLATNRFQNQPDLPPAALQKAALDQFEMLAAALSDAGVEVLAFDDTPEPHTPDAIFPNNWVSFHEDGTVVLYPMQAENRRAERRPDVVDALAAKHGFAVRRIVDLSQHESHGRFLEGTGSMVLDRANHVAYACLSPRTHLDPLGDFAQQLDYEVVTFDAVDRNGVPIYHTNVLMNVGEKLAVLCDEAIPRRDQRDAVVGLLEDTGHEVLSLSFEQLEAFAGNMLELKSGKDERVIAMSRQAWNSLSRGQRDVLDGQASIVAVPIDDIEHAAGGSVRCMLAAIHLPRQHTG